MQIRVIWLAVTPANSICRCVPSPGSNSSPSVSQRSRYPLWLRTRVGAWLAVPRTTSSRLDTGPDLTPGRAARRSRGLPAPGSAAAGRPPGDPGQAESVEGEQGGGQGAGHPAEHAHPGGGPAGRDAALARRAAVQVDHGYGELDRVPDPGRIGAL